MTSWKISQPVLMNNTTRADAFKCLLFYLTLLPVIGMMVIIFLFSSENAVQSSGLSGGVCREVICFVNEKAGFGMSEEQMILWEERIETPIRKCAHFSEYALLGVVTCIHALARRRYKKKNISWKKMSCGVLGFCVLYAMTDEFHQLFVPGRAGKVFDVGVDSAGAAVGILLCSAALGIYARFAHRKL